MRIGRRRETSEGRGEESGVEKRGRISLTEFPASLCFDLERGESRVERRVV